MAKQEQPSPEGNEETAIAAHFDDSLAELETLVADLEQGDLNLEDSLARFERGVMLARQCREQLTAAEQKVQQLLAREDGEELNPHTNDSATES